MSIFCAGKTIKKHVCYHISPFTSSLPSPQLGPPSIFITWDNYKATTPWDGPYCNYSCAIERLSLKVPSMSRIPILVF